MWSMFKQISKTKIIIGILVIGILILITYRLIQRNHPPTPTSSTPAPTLTSDIVNSSDEINYTLNLPAAPNLPSTLEAFTIEYPRTEDVVTQITQTFGLGEPTHTVIQDYEQYIWKKGNEEVTYNPNTQIILYHNYALQDGPALPEDKASQQAELYFKDKIILPENMTIIPTLSRYIISNGNVGKQVNSSQEANLTELQFDYTLNNKPISISPHFDPSVQININQQGVQTFKVKLPPKIVDQNKTYNLISSQEALKQLATNKATILKADANILSDAGELFDINQMIINHAEAGYVVDNKTIIPTIFFSGLAPQKQNPKELYQVTVGVPAESIP
jgi:hypothetical protein